VTNDRRRTVQASILVVEDNPFVLDSTALALEHLGHEVRLASHGTEALNILDEIESIDLVLADVKLPGELNGLEVAREVQKRYPEAKILLASAYQRDELISAGKVDEGMAFLTKPFSVDDLEREIQRLLAG